MPEKKPECITVTLWDGLNAKIESYAKVRYFVSHVQQTGDTLMVHFKSMDGQYPGV